MPNKHSIIKEPMSYKQQVKENELIAKLRIIREVKVHFLPKTNIAYKFSMHRNTIRNIITDFEEQIAPKNQIDLLQNKTLTKQEIEEKLFPMKNESRKPHWNKRCADKQQEGLILKYYHEKNLRIGYKRMFQLIKRRAVKMGTESDEDLKEIDLLIKLTYSQLRGIYKRNDLKVHKVRTASGDSRPLYDYNGLSCFGRLHYDTKTIPDKKALPDEIYTKFKLQKDLPIIEWNIIDVKSRFRFIAYSHERTSEFGLHFLLLVIQFIRSLNILWGEKIIIGTDNGCEFFSGSERKKAEWNEFLEILNAEIYSYEPGFDIRKNLIERSHRTDDEEFFAPRGIFINDKKSFMIEAKGYTEYYNAFRPHSGIEMHDMTPLEKIKSCGIHNTDKLMEFPTMILEDTIGEIKKATEILRVNKALDRYRLKSTSTPFLFDQKFLADLKYTYKSFFTSNAQNVLTYYQYRIIIRKKDY